MTSDEAQPNASSGDLTNRELRVLHLSPAEIAERYGPITERSTQWRYNRRRNRALGLDRFGRPLPRVAGTNPRATEANPRETDKRGVRHVG